MKVLVVEHEAFLAELIKLALEADGHACFTSSSVEEASDLLQSMNVDLLTLDLFINGHSPLPWLEDLVATRPEMQGRIFVLTGRLLDHTESVRVRKCSARVIQKPFTLHQLRETVRMMTP